MLTGPQLQEFLDNELMCESSIVLDRSYMLLTRDDFLNKFAPALWNNLRALKVAAYKPEANDCDDFSLYALALAKLTHRFSTDEQKAVAVGMVGFTQDSGAGHAIIFAVIREQGKLVLVFLEPQQSKEKVLSENEKQSVRFYLV